MPNYTECERLSFVSIESGSKRLETGGRALVPLALERVHHDLDEMLDELGRVVAVVVDVEVVLVEHDQDGVDPRVARMRVEQADRVVGQLTVELVLHTLERTRILHEREGYVAQQAQYHRQDHVAEQHISIHDHWHVGEERVERAHFTNSCFHLHSKYGKMENGKRKCQQYRKTCGATVNIFWPGLYLISE